MKKIFFAFLALFLLNIQATPVFAQKKVKKQKTTKKTAKKTRTPKAQKGTSATKEGNNTPEVNIPLQLWNVEKDTQTGLFYYVNAETNQKEGETGFDYAETFQEGQPVAEVRIRDDRYIMARNGHSLLDHAAFTVLYTPGTHYVQLMDKMSCFLMDFHGRAISAGYDFMTPVAPYLFGVSGSTEETLKIIGIDDKPITEMEVEHIGQHSLHSIPLLDNRDNRADTIPAYIQFRQDGKSGVMNLAGEIIIPAEYDDMQTHALHTSRSLPKQLRDVMDLNAYHRCLFFFCSNEKMPSTFTVFDQSGQTVGKVKGDTPAKAYDKNFKKTFLPHLLKHAASNLAEQKIYHPYYTFLTRMQQYDASLPATVRPSTLNLFPKAQERRDTKMQQ